MSAAPASPWPRPVRCSLEGRWTRLEPLGPQHAADLYAASTQPGAEERFRWLFEEPPPDLEATRAWIARAAALEDPLHFAVLDREWPGLRREYDRWLAPANFAPDGRQLTPLRFA